MITWSREQLPRLTLAAFMLLALLLWLNAAINRYRFNVALALLGSIPLIVLLVRAAVISRRSSSPSPG